MFSNIIMTFAKFNEDLKVGKEIELKYIEIKGMQNYKQTEGKNSDYDVICFDDNKETKYEIKYDKMSLKTGNICIEFECRGKLSGVSVTKCSYWIQYLTDDEIYEIPINDLYELINGKKYKCIIKGGDDKASYCYLFNKSVFNNYKMK